MIKRQVVSDFPIEDSMGCEIKERDHYYEFHGDVILEENLGEYFTSVLGAKAYKAEGD